MSGLDGQGGRSGEWSNDDPVHRSLRDRGARNWWRPIGIALAVMLTVGGLLVVGAIVIMWVGMANYGSNK